MLLEEYLSADGKSDVARKITDLELTDEQSTSMRQIVETILTDTHYSLLLGLAGAGSIGPIQQPYQVYDENGELLSDYSDLESAAFECFHEDK
jgi:hypothetical protein